MNRLADRTSLVVGAASGIGREVCRLFAREGAHVAVADHSQSAEVAKLVEEIEGDLQRMGRTEVPASVIGDAALARLKGLDPVAYVRYASVYRDFDSLDGFVKEIREYEASDDVVKSGSDDSQLELIPNEYAIPPKPKAKRGRRPGITEPSNVAFRPA